MEHVVFRFQAVQPCGNAVNVPLDFGNGHIHFVPCGGDGLDGQVDGQHDTHACGGGFEGGGQGGGGTAGFVYVVGVLGH